MGDDRPGRLHRRHLRRGDHEAQVGGDPAADGRLGDVGQAVPLHPHGREPAEVDVRVDGAGEGLAAAAVHGAPGRGSPSGVDDGDDAATGHFDIGMHYAPGGHGADVPDQQIGGHGLVHLAAQAATRPARGARRPASSTATSTSCWCSSSIAVEMLISPRVAM